MKNHNRVIKRRDSWMNETHPSSWEDAYNDLESWALYVLVDDSVMRITYLDKNTGMVKFDWLTSTELIPEDDMLQYKFDLIFQQEAQLKEMRELEKNFKGIKPWKFIRRQD